MATIPDSAGTGPPQLASHVDSFDAPLRFLIAIAARAAAATRLPANASISAEDIDIVAEGLSAFSLNQAKEVSKASPPAAAAAATDVKERRPADEKAAPSGSDGGEEVKEVDVAEVQAQAKEIAAAQAPQVSEEEMRREREKQRRTLQVVVSQNSTAAQERKRAAREWADEVARHYKLDPVTLPPSPRAADVKPAVRGLSQEKHADILHDILMLSIHLPPPPKDDDTKAKSNAQAKPPPNAGVYTPLARYLVFAMAQILNIPTATVYSAEKAMAQQLYFVLSETKKAEEANAGGANGAASTADHERMKAASEGAIADREKKNSTWKWAATGAGFLAGGVLLGVTGGLAAPLIAPLLVTATGSALSFLATSGGAVLLGTLFGVTGGGLTAFRAKRRMEGIEEFEFVKIEEEDVPSIPSLSATIIASGFLVKEKDWIEPYRSTFLADTKNKRDVFALKAETGVMLRAGKALDSYVSNFLIGKGIAEIIKRTALAAVFSAIALPTTVYKTATKALDNDFQQATDRAHKAGIILADVLEKGVQGNRPTILIGSSLGAVTIMSCLLELHQRNISGVVFDAIMISLPAAPTPTEWLKMRQVTSRRLVNAYSSNDWVLAIIARLHTLISTKLSFGVAGLQAVNVGTGADGTPIVENIDLSGILRGHLELAPKMGKVLAKIGMET